MKKIICLVLALGLLGSLGLLGLPARAAASREAAEAAMADALGIAAPSAVLVHASGTVLYEKNPHEVRIPASVTKVMTLLLAMEALDSGALALDEMVTATAHAASMGGTQVYLEAGEQMSVDTMLKCIAIASANDCSVALAEHMAGSEEAFVQRMNQRAHELGMADTSFFDCSGLSESNRTTAWDIALMSLEIMGHERILDYTTVWHDTIRDGAFGLDSKNRMLKTFDGLNGLKTGWVAASGYNISATATRGDMDLIAVVLGGATADSRNADAAKLLSYGFASFASVALTPDTPIMPVEVYLGKQPLVACGLADTTPRVYDKGKLAQVEKEVVMSGPLTAPVAAGTLVGELVVRAEGEVIARVPIITLEQVTRQGVWDIFKSIVQVMCCR